MSRMMRILPMLALAPLFSNTRADSRLGVALTNYDPVFLRKLADIGVRSVRLFDAADLGKGVCPDLGRYNDPNADQLLDHLLEVGIDDVTINLHNWATTYFCHEDQHRHLTNCPLHTVGFAKLLAQYVKNYTARGMNISVAIGNEPFSHTYWFPVSMKECVPKAIENVVAALKEINLSVPVTVPFSFTDLEHSYPPENAVFKEEVAPLIVKIAKSIHDSGSVFMIHAFPWSAYVDGSAPLDKALGDVAPYQIGDKTYTGILSQQVEAFRSALRKLGFEDVIIAIGETGWPADHLHGYKAASGLNAQKYFKHLKNYTEAANGGLSHIFLFKDFKTDYGYQDFENGNFSLFVGNESAHSYQLKYDVQFPKQEFQKAKDSTMIRFLV